MANSISVGGTLETKVYVGADNSSYSDAYGFRLSVTLNSQSTSNNTSDVTVRLDIDCRWSGAAWSSKWPTWDTYISYNGGSKIRLAHDAMGSYTGGGRGVWTNLLENSYTIPHNDNGTATFSVYYESVTAGGWSPDSSSGEITNISLPTIARFPKLRVRNGSGWSTGTVWVRNGSGWTQAKEVYVRNGSNWVATTDRGS